MIYQINKQHYESVLLLPAPKRYDYFVKRVADWQKAWALQGDKGWLTASDDSGTVHLPLWPHPLFAEMSATGDWSKADVVPVDVHELVDEVLPRLTAENHLVSIMPTTNGRDISVTAERLRNDLLAELEKIE